MIRLRIIFDADFLFPPAAFFICSRFVLFALIFFLSVNTNRVSASVEGEWCPEYTQTIDELKNISSIEGSHQLFEALDGKIIRSITYRRINVFNEENKDEDAALYQALNKLHVITKESTLSTQLLFAEGDRLQPNLVIESERVLRARKYLSNAFIIPAHVCGDSVDILVISQDAWTTNPEFSAGRKGGESSYAFGFVEGNILGSGNRLSIGYESDPDRNSVNYDFSSHRFYGRPISLAVGYADTSDGENIRFNIGRPFYSLTSSWSVGTQNEISTQIETITRDDTVVNEYQHKLDLHEFYYGLATNMSREHVTRVFLGATSRRDEFLKNAFSFSLPPVSRELNYVWLGLHWLTNNFSVYRNLNQIQRIEDVAIGPRLKLRIGYGGSALSNDDDVTIMKLNYKNTLGLSESQVLEVASSYNARFYSNGASGSGSLLGLSLAHHYLLSDKHRWYTHWSYHRGKDLLPHEELTVGGEAGLRGYPTDFRRGRERFLFTVERRYFSNIHLFNFLRLGGTAFMDIGKLRSAVPENDKDVLANVGFGLRMSSSKTHLGRVIHIDFAFPIDRDPGLASYQLLLGAESKF